MSTNEQQSINEMLNEILRCSNKAKRLLDGQNMTEVYKNLKCAHNAITKTKNSIVDIALSKLDSID